MIDVINGDDWVTIRSDGGYVTPDGLSVELICKYTTSYDRARYGCGYEIDDEFVYHRVGEPAYYTIGRGYITWDIDGNSYWKVREYCAACGFDEEMTLYWVLKYGEDLPQHIDQL